jgi:prepilin-type N-terminal cleavage/methylation domain-containing protein
MRDRKGFTLIELLIVVVIIGILAAIAVPKFSATREKAYLSAMKSDLKNLQTQQEIYYADHSYTYASDITNVDLAVTASDGVTIAIGAGAATGWSATATHVALSGTTCGVFVGSATSPDATNLPNPGVVDCW